MVVHPFPCRICGAPTIHAHMGVNACRSCSVFFKRTLRSKGKIVCNGGAGKCSLEGGKEEWAKNQKRGLCQWCRFERVKEVLRRAYEEAIVERKEIPESARMYWDAAITVGHSISARSSTSDESSKEKKKDRRIRSLFCGRCKEHRKWTPLKGHAAKCPFIDCSCRKCVNVTTKRAKAIIRRYRRTSTKKNLVLKRVRYINGNARFRVICKNSDCEGNARAFPLLDTMDNQKLKECPQASSFGTNQVRINHERSVTEEHNFNETRKANDASNSEQLELINQLQPTHQLHTFNSVAATEKIDWTLPLSRLLNFPLPTPIQYTINNEHQVLVQPSMGIAFCGAEATNPVLPSTTFPINCSIEARDPKPIVAPECITAEKWPGENGSGTLPILLGKRISRNMLLSLDADCSHPMFWSFLRVVQKLEDAMLSLPSTSIEQH